MDQVGFVGLGDMGGAIAQRIIDAVLSLDEYADSATFFERLVP